MKIILPPHKKQSMPVEKLSEELQKDIDGMEKLMKTQKFENGRKGYAVAHCQVSQNPYRIFVLREDFSPHTVVINAKIIEKSEPFTEIEMCLSFPFRAGVKVKRYFKIKAKYQDRYLNEHEHYFEGITAQIFQHEIQHFNGQTIYDK